MPLAKRNMQNDSKHDQAKSDPGQSDLSFSDPGLPFVLFSFETTLAYEIVIDGVPHLVIRKTSTANDASEKLAST